MHSLTPHALPTDEQQQADLVTPSQEKEWKPRSKKINEIILASFVELLYWLSIFS